MFELRFLSAVALSLGTIALTVATAAVLDGGGEPEARTASCGLDAVPEVGISVLSCEDPYDVDGSRVWAIVTHDSHCIAETGAAAGPWELECDNGVDLTLDSSYDGAWTSCGIRVEPEVAADLSASCRLSR